ncbi:Zinc transporter ZIP1 [Cryptotermes secundus]|uniref:Zinc transporter ZIP1 n=1 Tax=Cryptotermes secundus TaxID=105785 RepID=A0A2J7R3E5_9NEOP|nr:zinc transporter ZIP1 [Cryptotermes secundus]PNF35346.1 Zinc transporter ZIP1 [Cryptotermes secundus]
MELVSTKIVVLTLLGVIRLFFGLVPLKITKKLKLWGESGVSDQLVERRRARVDTAISLGLCFGGGVLLATCFIHMIPEVRESLEVVKRSGFSVISHDTSFPFAELLICCGFFLVYVIEEIAHRLFVHSDRKEFCVRPSLQYCSTAETELKKTADSTEDKFGFHNDADAPLSAKSRQRSSGKIVPASSQVHLIASSLSLEHSHCATLPQQSTVINVGNCHPCDGKATPEMPHHHHSGYALDSLSQESMVGGLRRFLVVVALSFHSVFEGLAIGLQHTQRDVWYLFTAVSIHACAILFCIGLELVTSGIRLLNLVLYVVILSLVSPLGVVVGILVTVDSSTEGPVQDLVVAVMQGIAGGTILYITFFEVLDREKRKETGCGIIRLVFILVGFSMMVALQALGGHDHVKGEGHKFHAPNTTSHLRNHNHDHHK